MNSIDLGSSPYEESCEQVGRTTTTRQLIECRAFVSVMQRLHPCVAGTSYKIVRHDHDFGPYYTVEATVRTEDDAAFAWMYQAEEMVPALWPLGMAPIFPSEEAIQ